MSIETFEQKKRRLFGKQRLPRYLEELSRLLKKNINEQDLLSIVDTDKFMLSVLHFKNATPDYKKKIRFSDKTTLREILFGEVSDWDTPYMMYLSDSLDCGLLEIPSLSCFNLDFSFYDEHAGIIIFTRVDGKEKIILDYDEEDGEYFIELEIMKKKTI